MEKQPENKEPKERKEGRGWWSKLGVVALASSMASACIDIERRSTAQVGGESAGQRAEHGMRVAGEDPTISTEREFHKDSKGYTTGSTLHAKIVTRDKAYRVDLDLGPLRSSTSAVMEDPIITAHGGYPVAGPDDPTAASWFDMDAHGNGVVVKFIPVVDQKGDPALQVSTKYYKNGQVWNEGSDIGRPNADR